VAEAQAALDAASLAQFLAVYNSDNQDELAVRLREIGYQPTFYTLPETDVEARVSLAMSVNQTTTVNGQPGVAKPRMYAAPINASSTNKYNLDVKASATLKFKVVPVPPPGEVTDIRVVPDLVGKTLGEAESLLVQLGLVYEIAPDQNGDVPATTSATVIANHTASGGEYVKVGDVLTLTVVA
ncbi:MAG TPA: hypothetical protein DCR93_00265, partial [Cytophagales bacterium]|nr:hypothetical protein [Cytophagales bacterium]